MNFYYIQFENGKVDHIYANSKKELLDTLRTEEKYRKLGKPRTINQLGLTRGTHANPNDKQK